MLNLAQSLFLIGEGLIWGKDLLQKELERRIGDGRQINIRTNNWIPDDTVFKLYNPYNLPDHIIKVSNLIDHSTKAWNTSIIQNYLVPLDTERILKIPLPHLVSKDIRAWLPALDDEFTV